MNPRATVAFSPYALYLREDWARLRADTPMPLSEAELENLSGLTERISTEEVVDIYLPLSRLLNLYVESAQTLHASTTRFLRKSDSKMPFIIGLAGSVAAGKSTTARVLRALLARWPNHRRVDLVPTDGFLFPNAELEGRGMMERKGFPESYELTKLLNFLAEVKSGKPRGGASLFPPRVRRVAGSEARHRAAGYRHCRGSQRASAGQAAEGRRGHSLCVRLLRFLDLHRRCRGAGGELVCRALFAAEANGVPRSRLLFPPLRVAFGRRGSCHGACHLAVDQPRQSPREHPADAAARRSHPAQGRRSCGRDGSAQEALIPQGVISAAGYKWA